MKAHIVVHHLATDNFWEGVWVEVDHEDIIDFQNMIKTVIEDELAYFSMNTVAGNRIYIPMDVLKESVWHIEQEGTNENT